MRHHERIENTIQLRETIRAGEYAWPGAYPVALLMDDGDVICIKCGRDNYRSLSESLRMNLRDGWRTEGCFINWEDENLSCAHCGGRIESAYGSDE